MLRRAPCPVSEFAASVAAPVPADRTDRCAAQSALRADPMLGTAFPASRLLLVEQPGPWGRAGLLDSRFDRRVARRLIARLDAGGVRVLAIRRAGRSAVSGPRRWGFADCRPGRESMRWGTFDEDAELLGLDAESLAEVPAHDAAGVVHLPAAGAARLPRAGSPVFLVCAHGTHDVCCAMRGRPVAAALTAVRPGQVWECSHVGGDRFAANVLVLPTGVLYGRLPESAAALLADCADRGRVLERHLRGRVGFPPDQQAALAHIHREMPGLSLDQVEPLGSSRVEPGVSAVRVRAGEGVFEVSVRAEQSPRQWLTCQASQPSSATVYRPESIRPALAHGA